MRNVSVYDLREGMRLGETLIDANGTVLLAKGRRLSSVNIDSIKQRGYACLIIDDEESAGIRLVRPLESKTEVSILKALKELDVDRIQLAAKDIVAHLIEGNIYLADMESIKTYDDYTYQHSLEVGTLAAIVGLAAGFTVADAERLTCAGLLHDLGKTMISSEIINAPRKLTEYEYEQIRNHSEYGYNLLKDKYDVPAAIRVAIYQHHENEDGSGYPRHVKGDKIHKYAKIIHCCDVFDALTSKRTYREPVSRREAIDYLRDHTSDLFSKMYTMVFTQCVCPYPTGTTLKFTSGEIGVVVSNSAGNLDNPVIRIMGRRGETTLEESGLMIEGEVSPAFARDM